MVFNDYFPILEEVIDDNKGQRPDDISRTELRNGAGALIEVIKTAVSEIDIDNIVKECPIEYLSKS